MFWSAIAFGKYWIRHVSVKTLVKIRQIGVWKSWRISNGWRVLCWGIKNNQSRIFIWLILEMHKTGRNPFLITELNEGLYWKPVSNHFLVFRHFQNRYNIDHRRNHWRLAYQITIIRKSQRQKSVVHIDQQLFGGCGSAH